MKARPVSILAFQGSPRLGGNTDLLLEAFLQGAEEEGAQIEKFHLYRMEFSPCLECGGCDETGECILEDDLTPLYPRLLEADVVVLASPVFFYNLTSRTQALVERAQACWIRRYVLKQTFPKRKGGLLLAVGATRGPKLFEGLQRVVRYFFDALGLLYRGGLFYRGVEKKGEIRQHPTALKEAFLLGKAVGQDLSPEKWPLGKP